MTNSDMMRDRTPTECRRIDRLFRCLSALRPKTLTRICEARIAAYTPSVLAGVTSNSGFLTVATVVIKPARPKEIPVVTEKRMTASVYRDGVPMRNHIPAT